MRRDEVRMIKEFAIESQSSFDECSGDKEASQVASSCKKTTTMSALVTGGDGSAMNNGSGQVVSGRASDKYLDDQSSEENALQQQQHQSSPEQPQPPPQSSTTTAATHTSKANSISNRCAGCRQLIKDKFLFSVIDLNWHQDCVQCCVCSMRLHDRCYTVDGKLYCKLDYLRKFGPKCYACSESIDRSELVQRIKGNRIYHLKCFTCDNCRKQLKAGEQLHLIDNGTKLLCKQDYQLSNGLLTATLNGNNEGGNNGGRGSGGGGGGSGLASGGMKPEMHHSNSGGSNNNNNYHHKYGNNGQQQQTTTTTGNKLPLGNGHYNSSNKQQTYLTLLGAELGSGAAKPAPSSATPSDAADPKIGRSVYRSATAEEGAAQRHLFGGANEEDDEDDDEDDVEDDDDVGEDDTDDDDDDGGVDEPDEDESRCGADDALGAPNAANDDDNENEENRSARGERAPSSLKRRARQVNTGSESASKRRRRRRQQVVSASNVGADLCPIGGSKRAMLAGESILNGSSAQQQHAMLPAGSLGVEQGSLPVRTSATIGVSSASTDSSSMGSSLGGGGGVPSNHNNSNNNNSNGTGTGNGSSAHQSGGGHKPTRVRTVLNEKQLQTLRDCYAHNPRPDALMKEQLVDMTGLSPRVIRVWFQNKRCKDKKKSILYKQMQQHEKDGRAMVGLTLMRGVPMVAASPIQYTAQTGDLSQQQQPDPSAPSDRTSPQQPATGGSPAADSPVGGGLHRQQLQQTEPAVDIHAYAPPWKSLVEYAQLESSASQPATGEPPTAAAALRSDEQQQQQRSINAASPRYQQLMSQIHGYTTSTSGPTDHNQDDAPAQQQSPFAGGSNPLVQQQQQQQQYEPHQLQSAAGLGHSMHQSQLHHAHHHNAGLHSHLHHHQGAHHQAVGSAAAHHLPTHQMAAQFKQR